MNLTHCPQGHEYTLENTYLYRGWKACRECNRHKALRYKRRNIDSVRIKDRALQAERRKDPKYLKHRLKKKYGMTYEQREDLFISQGSKCASCETTETNQWCVDHDHSCCPGQYTCGKCVRGILCNNCNTAAGLLKDSPGNARLLADYIEKHKEISCLR